MDDATVSDYVAIMTEDDCFWVQNQVRGRGGEFIGEGVVIIKAEGYLMQITMTGNQVINVRTLAPDRIIVSALDARALRPGNMEITRARPHCMDLLIPSFDNGMRFITRSQNGRWLKGQSRAFFGTRTSFLGFGKNFEFDDPISPVVNAYLNSLKLPDMSALMINQSTDKVLIRCICRVTKDIMKGTKLIRLAERALTVEHGQRTEDDEKQVNALLEMDFEEIFDNLILEEVDVTEMGLDFDEIESYVQEADDSFFFEEPFESTVYSMCIIGLANFVNNNLRLGVKGFLKPEIQKLLVDEEAIQLMPVARSQAPRKESNKVRSLREKLSNESN